MTLKQSILTLALALTAAQGAFAQDGSTELNLETNLELQTQADSAHLSDRDERIAKAIIGGVIGHIADEIFDDHDRGRRGRPGRPDYRDRNARYVCYAQNRRGQYFRGPGVTRSQAMARAMDVCYSNSRSCYESYCDRVR